MNYLRRRIGIWYNDEAWAVQLFSDLLDGLQKDYISKLVPSDLFIELIDGTIIKFEKVNEKSKLKFTESYIENHSAGYEELQNYIWPSICNDRTPYLIERSEDILTSVADPY